MKIIVPAVAHSSGISGVQRHAINLLRCLLCLPQIESVGLVIAPWQRDLFLHTGLAEEPRVHLHVASLGPGAVARNYWYYHELPKLIRREQPSLVHFSYPIPVNAPALCCPAVLTLHDMYPFQIPGNFGFPKVLFNQLILQQSLRAVRAIACVSDATRDLLRQRFPTVAEKAVTIPNCIEQGPASALSSPLALWSGEPFLLCVAQHRQNKNIALAIQAFSRLLRSGKLLHRAKLVIVGIDGPETSRLHRLVTEMALDDSVLFLQGLTDPELQWCYSHCDALLAPSLTEGFGLPVAEGLLAGTRVICSDIAPFREIGGQSCTYVSLSDRADLAFSEATHEALLKPVPQPMTLPQFSAATLALRYAVLYERVLAKTMSPAPLRPELTFTCSKRKAAPMSAQGAVPIVDALGVRVDALTMETAMRHVHAILQQRHAAYICVAGVHGVMEAKRDTNLLRAYENAELVVPDGMPLVWLGRMQGHAEMERVTGPDLMLQVFRDPALRHLRHFFYGGDVGVAELLKEKMLERFPWAQIVGTWTPPFRDLNETEEEQLYQTVGSAEPDIIWVGISCPRQELFMVRHHARLNVPVMVGVGAAFDFHTGRIRDCSDWIKRAGLQWLHRLVQDPRRLWKRYLRNNPAFVWQVTRQVLGLRRAHPRQMPTLTQRDPVQSTATKS